MSVLSIILTSSVVSDILSALVSVFISIKSKNLDYKYNYYKEIITKRLNAYQYLEAQVTLLKNTVLDSSDGRPYHDIFSHGKGEFINFQQNLFLSMSNSIWIDEDTVNLMQELNDIFYNINIKIENEETSSKMISVGKSYYAHLSAIRKELEHNLRKDLFDLHNMKRFFKNKTSGTSRLIKIYKGQNQ
ncbi:hypothetical protein [Hymenobacter terrestris]|uniref:Uncharacterized protein n=1 Tax=Hymenobacter terrestris TaxID=2748310 RepID=A0ABX2Q3Q7_9BACT|nr:hypothetical protein [Hymenobacter terrestris]NVO85564.1 hypothetical protein [Hymenobacter terrestris]